MRKLLLFTVALMCLTSCNYVTKMYGGRMEVELPANCEPVGCTWKGNSLWVTYKDTLTNTLHFKEYSQLGMMEGEVLFRNKNK